MTTLGIGTMPHGRVVNLIGKDTGIIKKTDIPSNTTVIDNTNTASQSGEESPAQDLSIQNDIQQYLPYIFIVGFLAVAYLILKD